jgi:rhodanese-related sulfurtransferase
MVMLLTQLALIAVACDDQSDDGGSANGDVDSDADSDSDVDCAGDPVLDPLLPDGLYDDLGDKDFLLINVHIPFEGEIAGTDVHIPFDDTGALAEYIGPDLATEVVVYCRSGNMSNTAGNALVDLGYCAVRNLEGGMVAWEEAGFPLAD